MGNGMTCSTTEIRGGAEVEQVEQIGGDLACSTTTSPYGGGGGGGAAKAGLAKVEQNGQVCTTITLLRQGFGVEDIAVKTGRCVTAIRAEVQRLRQAGILASEIYGGRP